MSVAALDKISFIKNEILNEKKYKLIPLLNLWQLVYLYCNISNLYVKNLLKFRMATLSQKQWKKISCFSKLPKTILIDFKKALYWDLISKYYHFQITDLIEFHDVINWEIIFKNYRFKINELKRMLPFVPPLKLIRLKKLKNKFLKFILERYNNEEPLYHYVLKYQSCGEDLILFIYNNNVQHLPKKEQSLFFYLISKYQHLTTKLLSQFKDDLLWHIYIKSHKLKTQDIITYIKYLNIDLVLKYQKLNNYILNKNILKM